MKVNQKILSVLLIAIFVLVCISGCKKDKKSNNGGVLSVENSITPLSVASGETITWDIIVTNSGDAVQIDSIVAKEQFISGWAAGQAPLQFSLPSAMFDDLVAANATETVFTFTGSVVNTGNTDVEVKNTVTVYYESKSCSSYTTYEITMAKKKSGIIEAFTLLNDLIGKAE